MILFVYNADAGFWNAVLDSLHKTFRPKTYPCSLCAITYGTRKMRPAWKSFLETEFKEVEYSFLHKDEFLEKFGADALNQYPLPTVLAHNKDQLTTLIPAKEMDQLSLTELIEVLRKRVLEF